MENKHHSRTANELTGVTELGSTETKYATDYDPSVLETFINKHPQNDYLVTFDGYEFTSLCPKTGQPDFANVFISYIPTEKMVESKSLKLYLFSFRNHGDFHEDCMNIILDDLYKLMNPKYIEVLGLFTPRGGISIYPFVNRVNPTFKTAELQQLAFQRKLQFLGNVQSYGRSIR
ncbi:preQ(1) synthase [Liquorilactobacillus capillatus]|uniref:NADPH-dependent 7-cyano-7-deazaguanine reductase n=1 Tax=Liquorilactobacillus capillatus DSM 19910 TaxID=1423731 RepID=A0A0R1MGU7_9LACO|nr:preQ(1) synthase [Liquorilactobacillus capillatus]KRL03587.1 GTP cyclohydrolase family protein [Liquorilactobacillus capillatus DSM 19910]